MFWQANAVRWERRRYDSDLSKWLYSSLSFRSRYLAFLVDQLSPDSRVVEVGCGSGRLFGHLRNKKSIKYVGYDISPEAIEAAKNKWKEFPNAEWICADVTDIPEQSCDLVVSAGLLDWLSDDKIKVILKNIRSRHFAHSFSKDEKGLKTFFHKMFSLYQSGLGKNPYSPRKFSLDHIRGLFPAEENLTFVSHRDLSFGCITQNLPMEIFNYRNFKVAQYFEGKSGKSGRIENYFKARESKAAAAYLRLAHKAHVLEVGSGAGHYSRIISCTEPASLTCLDPYVSTPDFLSDGVTEFIKIAFEDAEIPKKFDFIVLFGVVEFASDFERFIAKIGKISGHGCKVLLLYPRSHSIMGFGYRAFHSKIGGVKIAVASEIEKAFHQNGFSLIKKSKAGPLNNLYLFEATHV